MAAWVSAPFEKRPLPFFFLAALNRAEVKHNKCKQEALQNAARRCSAANTTAVCRGCFVGNPGTTPGIAHGF